MIISDFTTISDDTLVQQLFKVKFNIQAIFDNSIDKIKEMVKENPSCIDFDPHMKFSPLHYAIFCEKSEIIQHFI